MENVRFILANFKVIFLTIFLRCLKLLITFRGIDIFKTVKVFTRALVLNVE